MSSILSYLHTAWLIVLVIVFFNFMIFVHELGHFLAGKWRGAYIDRFQIWFGRPLWKKKLWGVEFGLGWIPAGGFVSLPQMEGMEGIEGKVDIPEEHRRPLKPLDKIIIAAAGPLFSLLLAFAFAAVVWGMGKPVADDVGTTVGYVQPDGPAAEAGVLPGDKILAVDGKPVTKWLGNMDGVSALIALSEHEQIEFTIERPGEAQPITIMSSFRLPPTEWWQRGAMRQVGIMSAAPAKVGQVLPHSPAELAGLRKDDLILAVDGERVFSPIAVQMKAAGMKELELEVQGADGAVRTLRVAAAVPANWVGLSGAEPVLGIVWAMPDRHVHLEYPTPMEQVSQSLKWMGSTLGKLFAPGSSVGVEHLSGPVGIGSYMYKMMSGDAMMGFLLVMWFAVVLNVNLAVLNILPLPVVDGGHVTLGLIELVSGKAVRGRFLDWIMFAFVFLLMAFFLFVTFKDVGDLVGGSKDPAAELPEPAFAPPQP